MRRSVQREDLKCDRSSSKATLLKSQALVTITANSPPQVHSATLTVSRRREKFSQRRSETLRKEQDFINNPFKVKRLPLQFKHDPTDSQGRLRGQVVIGVLEPAYNATRNC